MVVQFARCGWCERGDLNPHGFPRDPKSRASASSATLAHRFVEEAWNSLVVQTRIGCSLPAPSLSRHCKRLHGFVVIEAMRSQWIKRIHTQYSNEGVRLTKADILLILFRLYIGGAV
jgi:hypothetical protein